MSEDSQKAFVLGVGSSIVAGLILYVFLKKNL